LGSEEEMINDTIKFRNIKTNNLKGIDIDLLKNKINCIIGPSGSGKSSLAFDTIYAICEHEYKMIVGDEEIYNYTVDDYSDLLVAVALTQTNYNSNKRSTIATYYGLDNFFKYLFASQTGIPAEMFIFNKYSSSCKKCNGLGSIKAMNMSMVIDYDATIEDVPFLPWRNSMKDYYKQLLTLVAKDEVIPLTVPFRRLNNSMKDFLIFGSTEKRYKINYKQGSRKRIKTDQYHGVTSYIEGGIKNNNVDIYQYTTEVICPECNGTRFDFKMQKYKVFDKSIGDLYLMEFDELINWLVEYKKIDIHIKSINSIIDFVKNVIEMKLGYLFLNRSIPSLSGGEFQRLRLSQILHTKFENMLFVMDEPLSSLHAEEKDGVIKKIKKMKEKNTLLIVEHSTDILPICDNIITLGISGGERGGKLISTEDYLSTEKKVYTIKANEGYDAFHIHSNDAINNLKKISVIIPRKTCIGIGGISGSGKTTFVREILPGYIPNYKYISQKPIRGNVYSTIASYIGIFDKIREIFSKSTKADISWFSNFSNAKGACQICHGTGEIVVDDYNKKKFIYLS
jgi:excinuclease UvrABC ATPase subunit